MIARVWKGRVRRGLLAEYRAYAERVGVTDYLATPGNRGAYTLTRDLGDHGEIVMISFWEDEAAIERFAGAEIARARYYPEDQNYLLDFPEYVEHFDA